MKTLYNIIFFVTDVMTNKLECLSLASFLG